MNKYLKKELIIKDFELKNKDVVKLNFLKKVSKSPVYISKKTGLVFHNDPKSSSDPLVILEWDNKIYSGKMSGKMDPKNNLYTDDFPGMSSRHYYALDFFRRYTKLNDKKICDFASGEGGLRLKAKKYFNLKNLHGVDHSKYNRLKALKRFKGKWISAFKYS